MYAGALEFRRLGAVRGSESGPMKERMKTLWELCKKEMKSACAVFSVSGEEAMEDLAAVSPSMAELLRQAIRCISGVGRHNVDALAHPPVGHGDPCLRRNGNGGGNARDLFTGNADRL